MKLGKDTASLANWMMANNQTSPVEGQDMTILMWTDRLSYKVVRVIDETHIWVAEYDDCYDEETPLGTKTSSLIQPMIFRQGKWRMGHPEYDYTIDEVKFMTGWRYEKVSPIFGVRDGFRDPCF